VESRFGAGNDAGMGSPTSVRGRARGQGAAGFDDASDWGSPFLADDRGAPVFPRQQVQRDVGANWRSANVAYSSRSEPAPENSVFVP